MPHITDLNRNLSSSGEMPSWGQNSCKAKRLTSVVVLSPRDPSRNLTSGGTAWPLRLEVGVAGQSVLQAATHESSTSY